ncbi:Signal transduction histidine kinase [Geosmithia morbida]|uniref:histidine kinase n=1 Tax=Geosmithia morbida TaxID=1094350 RepID=A0A9P4Z2N2_9HYPO|nr:Signal transduction histidine kinase [Geosmithia morbida]KAF4126309.1 Signal transduction histidine kinase [Geosmithia morbida]
MDGAASDNLLDPPPRLYERLRQIAGYSWDESIPPFHSTYDFWHCNASSPGDNHHDYVTFQHQQQQHQQQQHQQQAQAQATNFSSPPLDAHTIEEPVVARLSYNGLREERAFHITKSLTTTADPTGEHIVKPIDLIRLTPVPGDRGIVTVAIYDYFGDNYLAKVLDMGPNWYSARKQGDSYVAYRKLNPKLEKPISLPQFLDFAIGASKCLEILHHGQGIVHGELRGDAFHFNADEGKVRIANFGSGVRSFEHGLTSSGWSMLSREPGAKNKLLYISPEQTGRMPAEPDSRTDIYALGVLFWMLLTQQPVYNGDTPLDIVQGVLGRRVPSVSEFRMDVPDALGRIIQKCTSKNITDRYHSASGLRHDLVKVQELLVNGDLDALGRMEIGSKDVSSFFMLPTDMIGRQKERDDLIKVIDRVAQNHAMSKKTSSLTSHYSDGSNLSVDVAGFDERSSDGGASSIDGNRQSGGSFTYTASSDPTKAMRTSAASLGAGASALQSFQFDVLAGSADGALMQSSTPTRVARPWERHQSLSQDTRSLVDSTEGNRYSGATDSGASSLSRQLGNAKFRRRGHCEVVIVEGAGGLGKSCLIQSILADARRRGYCATAKFDTSRKTAFGPLLKLLSSLFKQVWGERNTETPFHQGLKQYIRPVWPMLHRVLGLPEFLLGPPDPSAAITATPRSVSSQGSGIRNSASAAVGGGGSSATRGGPGKRRGSSPGSSPALLPQGPTEPGIRASAPPTAPTKSIRLMNTFLDVVRVFTAHKFICFCIEDLHFADDESLELISQIIAARLKMVVVVTYRSNEFSSESMHRILYPETDEVLPRLQGPTVTRITLSPLSEDDIVYYVSETLCRPRDDILSLALVIQSKTAGNPFYIREMLSACYRKKCIWYDYRDSMWHFDLERLFEQFRGEKDYDVLDTGFITRRLDELPPAARSMLAWAALLGNSFSFELVCRLMSGEFEYADETWLDCCDDQDRRGYTQAQAVDGLQAALQAYVIVASENDDRFSFAHDRFVHAAADLKECSARRMHFIIAQTLLKYYLEDARLMDSTAFHICEAADIIKLRVAHRRAFRRQLADCARSAADNGARPSAVKYYGTALKLLQPDPWNEGAEDVDYDETIELHIRATECHLYMGQHQAAHETLAVILRHAKTAIDKAPAYVLQSRLFSQAGNVQGVESSLRECLAALGVELDEEPTYDKCDAKFGQLSARVESMDRPALLGLTAAEDRTLSAVGAVLSEATGSAWWSDSLRYYYLALLMLEMHLTRGAFPQSSMAFLHSAVVALCRFGTAPLAVYLASVSQELLQHSTDPMTVARGLMLYPCLFGHVAAPMSQTLAQAEDAVDFATNTGDRMSIVLSYGIYALTKLFAHENVADLEAFCQYGCEEIVNWTLDTQGGAVLLVVRQVARAFQGKTNIRDPLEVLSDQQHSTAAYKAWLSSQMQYSARSVLMYETLELIPLFLYGHYDRAVEVGRRCLESLPLIRTLRNSRSLLLFYGLARAGQHLRQMQDPRGPPGPPDDFRAHLDSVVADLRTFVGMMRDWAAVYDANYFSWIKILEAQILELTGDLGQAVQHYEEALDHAAEHEFVFDEALANYLMAGYFLRRKARRSARAALLDAVGLYRQVGATGAADFIEEEHSLLLHGPTRNHRTLDAGVQTDFVTDTAPVQYRAVDGGDGPVADDVMAPPASSNALSEAKGDRIGAWRNSTNMQAEAGAGLPALDIIDLHTILVSSQVISSVLQIDQLLKTMSDVILQTCGSSATLAAIVVQGSSGDDGDSGWCVAASGEPEKGASAHRPALSLSGTPFIAENVVLYCTRFLEPVFIPDLISDERFGNVSDDWLRENPAGRAIIAIPIKHGDNPLHGVVYLEGQPGSFTDRNVTVLQLLVVQLSISYSNAVAMKNVEKISAENRSMVSVQQRALAKAREAETKAKNAEAEAKRNVKLAEEAARAKSIFLANVSHELRTPLNGVIGNSELLRDSNLNREQQEMADSIRVSADLLLTVINDILDFSKMEADKMKLYIIAFNPEEMVREVVRAVSYSNREKTSKKNVKIVQDINLPPMLIYGDPIRLHQVLGNLIGNSLKFTEDGSITIGARLNSETEESATLTFWVRDTGIGIPPQQLAKLFQPFSQADASTARKYGGSGLGLSICKSLIETMMKGKIQLESEETVGTTAWFTVSFDKAKSDVLAGDAQSKSPPPVGRSSSSSSSAAAAVAVRPRGGGFASAMLSPTSPDGPTSSDQYLDLSEISKEDVRICVAEDNPINQKIAIQYVQRLGYTRVSAYENGLKAVEGLRQQANEGNPYHIVLMDVQMPVLDGYEATKLIRKDPIEAVRKILVIAMTASAIQGDREKCLAAGMNDYLAKPVRSEVLKKKLDAYLGTQESTGPATGSVADTGTAGLADIDGTGGIEGTDTDAHEHRRIRRRHARPRGPCSRRSGTGTGTHAVGKGLSDQERVEHEPSTQPDAERRQPRRGGRLVVVGPPGGRRIPLGLGLGLGLGPRHDAHRSAGTVGLGAVVVGGGGGKETATQADQGSTGRSQHGEVRAGSVAGQIPQRHGG